MKKITAVLLILAMLALCSCSDTQGTARGIAESFLSEYTKGNYKAMTENFRLSDEMSSQITEEWLSDIWDKQLIAYCGSFRKLDTENVVAKTEGDKHIFVFHICFEYQDAVVLVSINSRKEVDSLRLMGYVNTTQKVFDDDLIAEEVYFGSDYYPALGTYVYSKNAPDKIPVVIIIPGSGPQDRFGRIGPNAVYYDIAQGLAKKGIGVLIFDKRTFNFGSELGAFVDISEEYLDDSYFAFAKALKLPKADPSRIYFLGHGLGGYLLPVTAYETEYKAAGYIFLAANSSPLEELLVKQHEYLAKRDGSVTDEEAALLESAKKMAADVKRLTEENYMEFDPEDLLGISSYYWLSLQNYKAEKLAADIKQPMLFLYAGNDYQVDLSEAEPFKKALAGRKNAEFRVMQGLNHVFMKSQNLPVSENPEREYYIKSEVDSSVIDIIAEFVLRR